jgi:hypothetical protein
VVVRLTFQSFIIVITAIVAALVKAVPQMDERLGVLALRQRRQ